MRGVAAILCSGQGGQHPGMFDLVAQSAPAQPIFAAATAVLGEDPRRWVHSAKPADLFSNRNGQILCCTQALAVWAALGDARPPRAVIAGYSVGELAAWSCGGMLDASTALRIAQMRAQAMDAAAPDDGGLAAIVGLKRSRLTPLLASGAAYVAIINGLDSFVVGGHRSDLQALCREASAHGARHVVMLEVAVPSHTPLLAAATPVFAQVLAETAVTKPAPAFRILTGIDGGAVQDVSESIDKLARQISTPVDWASCLDSCRAAGAQVALELGPGRALSRMAAEQFPDGAARSVEDFKSIEGLKRWLSA